MSLALWMRLHFFEKEELVVAEEEHSLQSLAGDHLLTCFSTSRGHIVAGDSDGNIYILSLHKEQILWRCFRAFQTSIADLLIASQPNVLVAVGSDSSEPYEYVVKVFTLPARDDDEFPLPERKSFKIPPSVKCPYSLLTCIAATPTLSQLALGFKNGRLLFFKSSVLRDRNPVLRDFTYPGTITGIELVLTEVRRIICAYLYASIASTDTTEGETVCHVFAPKGHEHVVKLCNLYAEQHCSVLAPIQETSFILGRDEAVYGYFVSREGDEYKEGQGMTKAIEGKKILLSWFRNYFVVGLKADDVHHGFFDSQKPTAIKEDGLPSGCLMLPDKVATIDICDIGNQLILYQEDFKGVVNVSHEGGNLYILTHDKKVHQLKEQDTETKLELLFSKQLFNIALSLATTDNLDPDFVATISKRYGDHLYAQGDYDGAIRQYILTIGHGVEASYVVRKFLDAQQVNNLTRYLEILHKKGLATTNHTTLLLNCYAKLRDTEKITNFLKNDREVGFDIETAVRVCQQSGYFEHALDLAKRFDLHEWILRLYIEDMKDYDNALKHLQGLDFEICESMLRRYGKPLMSKKPVETTEIITEICIGYKPRGEQPLPQELTEEAPFVRINNELPRAASSQFIQVFAENPDRLLEFLEEIVTTLPSASKDIWHTLLELYLQRYELSVTSKDSEAKEKTKNRLLDLLRNRDAVYDSGHALVLCQSHNFSEGVLFLYEKENLLTEVIRHFIHNKDLDGLMNIFRAKDESIGDDPIIWSRVLLFLASRDDCVEVLNEILQKIDEANIMSALQILQVLSSNPSVTLGQIRSFLVRKLNDIDTECKQHEDFIEEAMEDINKRRGEISALKGKARLFSVPTCSTCQSELDLPATHFLCGHSFHRRCLTTDTGCPLCAAEANRVQIIRQGLNRTAEEHDQFFKQLDNSVDGFRVVADYLGRSVFKSAKYVDQAAQNDE